MALTAPAATAAGEAATGPAGPVGSTPAPVGPRRIGRRWPREDPRWGRLLRATTLVVSPLVAFVGLRVRPMSVPDSIDAFIYTGYSQHGADLMARFGPDSYYWVRLGAILPERVSFLLFGAVPGFYVLRYLVVLLVVVPTYVVVARTLGRSAAWSTVALFLCSPVLYETLGRDYPDALVFGYLAGAAALLLLPVRGVRARAAAVVTAGVLLTLALHAQVVVAPVVGSLVVAWVVATVRRGAVRRVLVRLGWLVGAGLATTGVLVLVAWTWLGHADLFGPTLRNFRLLQTPAQLALWHSSDPGWATRVPYLVVPYVVAATWWVVWARVRSGPRPRVEFAAGVWLSLSAALAAYLQFLGTVGYLEYHLYSSALWPPTLLVLGFTVARLLSPARGVDPRALPVLAGVVVVAALVSGWVRLPGSAGNPATTLVLTAVAVLGVVAGVTVGVRRGWTPLAVTTAGVLVLALAVLTVLPTSKPVDRPDVSVIPVAHYDTVFGASHEDLTLQIYRAAARLPGIVGPATRDGERPLFWASDTVPVGDANLLQGTYLWHHVPSGTPSDPAGFAVGAALARPRPLVTFTTSRWETAAFLALFPAQGIRVDLQRTATLEIAGRSILVSVVEVEQP